MTKYQKQGLKTVNISQTWVICIKNLKNHRILEQQKSNNLNQNSNNYQVENSTENQQNLTKKIGRKTNKNNDVENNNNNENKE